MWARSLVGKMPWRREWVPTPVFLPGKLHRQWSLCPWAHKESDVTEWLTRIESQPCDYRAGTFRNTLLTSPEGRGTGSVSSGQWLGHPCLWNEASIKPKGQGLKSFQVGEHRDLGRMPHPEITSSCPFPYTLPTHLFRPVVLSYLLWLQTDDLGKWFSEFFGPLHQVNWRQGRGSSGPSVYSHWSDAEVTTCTCDWLLKMAEVGRGCSVVGLSP